LAGILFCKLWFLRWLVGLANVYDCKGGFLILKMRRIVRCRIVCIEILLHSIMDKEKLLKKFGEKVKLKRAELKLSQEELAFKCGFDRTYISLVERGLRNTSLSNLSILAEGLNTTISSLTKDL